MSDGPATGAPHSPHAQSAPGAPGAPLSRGLASAAVLVAAVGFSSISIATVIGTREGPR